MMNVKITEAIQIGALIFTSITTIVLILTYKRNSKIELENHFFKLKIEAYSTIVFEFESLFSKLREVILDIENAVGHEMTMPKDRLLTLQTEVDKSIILGDLILTKYSVFFNDKTVQLLQNFTENLYGYYTETLTLEELLDVMNSYYDKQLALANDVNNEIRKELKIEKLNKSLFRRY